MAAAGDVCVGLIRHKAALLRELCDTNVLDVLVKKGLFSLNDLELITSAADSDKCNYFVEVVSKQSGAKLSEVCSVLEKECPKLAKELMNDKNRFILNGFVDSAKDNMVMSHNLNRESPRSRRSMSQCSCTSVSRRSSSAASPMLLPPLNNTMEMYVEPVVEDVEDPIGASTILCGLTAPDLSSTTISFKQIRQEVVRYHKRRCKHKSVEKKT